MENKDSEIEWVTQILCYVTSLDSATVIYARGACTQQSGNCCHDTVETAVMLKWFVCYFTRVMPVAVIFLWRWDVPWLLKNTVLFFADVTDPVADVLSFIRLYEENYGYVHPVFYQGTYSQALNDAKQELRFLLVYLHCEEHEDTAKFCRWCTMLVSFAFLNE